jgi:hypothetical protein
MELTVGRIAKEAIDIEALIQIPASLNGIFLAPHNNSGIKLDKEISTMKHIGIAALLAIFLASLGGCTARRDRVIYQKYAGYNYCHTKVETAGDPLRPTEREIVDFYGPCDAFDDARRR